MKSFMPLSFLIQCAPTEGYFLHYLRLNWLPAYPRSENPDLHPTDEDLSVGTPDLGHPDS